MRYKVRTNYDDKRINNALLQLESALALDEPPMRIECFDISTIHGSYTVASMVVFTNGKPDKNQYRRFKIKTPLDEANVVRFGNYVRKIPDSQFLIITHRKPTMAICPVLFGVTMEEKGVSKLVSVKIEEKE